MIKKLTKTGNSYSLLIDKGVLDILKITADTNLDVTTDGDKIILQPIRVEDAVFAAIANNAETIVDIEERDFGEEYSPAVRALKVYCLKRKHHDAVKFTVFKDTLVSTLGYYSLPWKLIERDASVECTCPHFGMTFTKDAHLAETLVEQCAERMVRQVRSM